jgi:hypothetical protein
VCGKVNHYNIRIWGTWSKTSIAPSQLAQFWQIQRQNAFLSPVLALVHHDCPLAVKPAGTPWRLLPKQTSRDSLPTDMLLSAVSVMVVALLGSEVPEGLMNYSVYIMWSPRSNQDG